MIYVQDDFLPTDMFEWLSSKARLHSERGLKLSTNNSAKQISNFYADDNTAWDYSYKNLNNDLTIPKFRIGKELGLVVDLIEDIIKREKNVTKLPKIDSVFFLFGVKGYKVKPHIDIKKMTYDVKILSNNYKSFIFSHTDWKDDWGGELCFNSAKLIPKPNRLVIYSSDELHWVESVNEKAGNSVRKIFGIRWGSESIEDVLT